MAQAVKRFVLTIGSSGFGEVSIASGPAHGAGGEVASRQM